VEIRIGKDESLEQALKRFRRQCQKHGILSEMKKREYYEKPSERRKKREKQWKRKKGS
jgi:small subunit ribosomal protein S21